VPDTIIRCDGEPVKREVNSYIISFFKSGWFWN
jgi:hypothetical protein